MSVSRDPRHPRRPSGLRRAGGLRRALRVSGLAAAALSVACTGISAPPPIEIQSQLDPALEGVAVPLGPLDDHWTASLGHYLEPDQLGRYWLTPAGERFTRWGDRWLEFSLREELLEPHRDTLTPDELDRFTRQPDYDSSKRVLEQILAARSER